jgi:hypothetical protein
VILYADQLQAGDQLEGYGTVTSVEDFHRASCDGQCFGACTRSPRVVVEFAGQPVTWIFTTDVNLEVDRPEPPARDQEPELTSEDCW